MMHVPKKRGPERRQFDPETSKSLFFYTQYIVKVDECIDRTSTFSIWNPLSRLGSVFRDRFQVPYKVFDCICRYCSSEADTRLKSDNRGQDESYDCCILVLATMRVLARDGPFDSLEKLIYI